MSAFARALNTDPAGYLLVHLSSSDGHVVLIEVHAVDGDMLGTVSADGTLHLDAVDEEGHRVRLASREHVQGVLQADGPSAPRHPA